MAQISLAKSKKETNIVFWKKGKVNNYLTAFLFLLPFLVVYLWFWIYPIISGFFTSFTTGSFGVDSNFAGLENYKTMISDDKFWSALINTLYFILISTPVIVILGLIFALIVNSKLKGTVFLRSAYFIPYMLSISVIASIWKFMLQNETGLFAEILKQLGSSLKISWFGSWGMGWLSILIVTIWWTVGFNMILFLAGLQEISDELYEAADMDGANALEKFRYITLPSLRGVTFLVVLFQVIASFKLFGQTYLITNGGPGIATTPIVHYIYEIAFRQWNMGYASAVSFVLLLIIALISIIQYKVMNKN